MSEKYDIIEDSKPEIKRITLGNLKNTTTLVLIVGTVIAALVSMGEITLTMTGLRDLTLLCCIIFLISSLVYSTRYEASMEAAKQEDDYKETVAEYEEQKKKIHEKGLITELPRLCLRYREEDLKNYRSEILSDACISYDTYAEKYKDLTKKELEAAGLPKGAIRCILKANKATGVRLSSSELMSAKKQSWIRRAAISFSSETKQSIDTALNVVTRLATTFLSGAVVITVIFDPSLKAIAQWAVRMLPVVSAAISATVAGRRNIKNTAIPYYRRITEVIKLCIKWSEESIPNEED